ncbi:MAG TPA: RluA family pseudouridine synthase [Planctomycetota bacterium]
MRPLPILYRDERLAVVDKPPGLLSVPDAGAGARSVPELLAAQGLRALGVHRLDREVSGVLLVALDEEALQLLQDLFRAHAVEKVYWGMAAGHVEPPAGQLTFPILEEPGGARVSARGKPARTRYRTLVRHRLASELELTLDTGRKNQIRVHLAHAGHALVGERKYARGRDAVLALRSRRVALHAWRLRLRVPWTGTELAVEAPLPEDLRELQGRA